MKNFNLNINIYSTRIAVAHFDTGEEKQFRGFSTSMMNNAREFDQSRYYTSIEKSIQNGSSWGGLVARCEKPEYDYVLCTYNLKMAKRHAELRTIDTLSHETCHLVDYICEDRGINCTEARAYLTGFIQTNIFKDYYNK